MTIVTTLYDLIHAVSEECEDSDQVSTIVQGLINSRKVLVVSSSKRIRIDSPQPYITEHLDMGEPCLRTACS